VVTLRFVLSAMGKTLYGAIRSGDGLPKQFEIEKSRSTGMLLIRTFTSQLGGKLTGAGSPFQSELDASLFRRRLSTRSAYYRP